VRHDKSSFQLIFYSYFRKMTDILSSRPFYTTFVTPLDASIPSKIQSNPKFWPYFKDVVGAVDGCHIPISPPGHRASSYRNRKGFLSQNCLFVCGFDLDFKYSLCGWEGSASDVWVYEEVLTRGLIIPEGKYILGDCYSSRAVPGPSRIHFLFLHSSSPLSSLR
jgi:hypothetical protein